MRVAIAGFQHETNSFAKVKASLSKWEEAGILYGGEIIKEYRESKATIAGILSRLQSETEVDLVPLVFSRLMPMGHMTVEANNHLANEILTLIEEKGPWDVVFLAQHGAAVSDLYKDPDGELAERVRAIVGPDVIIVTNLDMHANISRKVVSNSDIVKVYQTNPHLDTFERAFESADLAVKYFKGEIKPTMYLATPPLVVNILKQGTDDKPMSELLEFAKLEMDNPGVLSVSVVEGYPYSDVPQMGMTFLAITNGDVVLAESVANKIALHAWDMRVELNGVATSTEEALTEANSQSEKPIVLFDVGDNVGAGTPGDSTFVLHAARRLGVSGVLQALCDPDVVKLCESLGVGARVEAEVGGKFDDMHGIPFPITGSIIAVTDGTYAETKPSHGGFLYYNDGPSAAIKTDDGYSILLPSLPAMSSSLLQFRNAGLDPLGHKIIVVKGVHSPRPAYEAIAKRMYWLDTAGASTADLANFKYEHRRVPMYPFEEDTNWDTKD